MFFVHIPKTGGSSLYEGNLMRQGVTVEIYGDQDGPCTAQHYHLAELQKRYPDYRAHRPFTVIRDPWQRTCSEYQWSNISKPWGLMDQWLDTKLNAYVKNREHFLLDNHLRPQCEFLDDDIKIFTKQDYRAVQIYIETQLGQKFDWSRWEKQQSYDLPSQEILSPRIKKLWDYLYRQDHELYQRHLRS